MEPRASARHRLSWIPFALIAMRVVAGPILLTCALTGHIGTPFFAILIVAIVTDILDGTIARKLGTSTNRLRQLDSLADVALFGQLSIGAALLYPAQFRSLVVPLVVLAVGRVLLYAACFVRYRRQPCYHAVTAKAWGLGLTVAFVLIFSGTPVPGLWIALILGYINTLDELAMTAILPAWHTDVLTIAAALKLRDDVRT